jgi:putative membrane protein
MIADLLLAVLHFILVFALVGILGAEAALVREGMDGTQVSRVAVLDRFYGAAAGLLLVVGFTRVFHGARGPDFYLPNPVFWAKIAAFALIAALSVPPTVRFIVWRGRAHKEQGFQPSAAEVRGVQRLIAAQAAVLLVIPLLAGMMARGYGL